MFIIEGRLTGEWVGELLSVTRNLPPGTNSVFQIEDVLFVDSLGERALQWLNHLGATFSVRNAYGVDLCQRLHLRRCAAEASAGRGKEGRRRLETAPEQPINSRNSKTLGQGCNEKD